jgi:hypothetical protein
MLGETRCRTGLLAERRKFMPNISTRHFLKALMIIGGFFLFNCTVSVGQVHQPYAKSFPEGSLIRLYGQDAIYVIQHGRKHHIPDADTFNVLGYRWDQVRDVNEYLFDSVPMGAPIPSTLLSEGGLIRLYGEDAVYVIQRGRKHHIPDADTLNVLGYRWDQVRDVNEYLFDSVPTGAPIPSTLLSEGGLIRLYGEDAVYVIQRGTKRHIPDVHTFNALGYRWDQVRDVNEYMFNSVPTGRPIPRR